MLGLLLNSGQRGRMIIVILTRTRFQPYQIFAHLIVCHRMSV
jgi:hypothetical protein